MSKDYITEVQDIYLNKIVILVREDGDIYINGKIVSRMFIHPDNTIELNTASEEERPLKYFFHGYQYWKIKHNEDEPTREFSGQLEARIDYIRYIASKSNGVRTIIEADTSEREGK